MAKVEPIDVARLNPGVRRLVALLRERGLETVDSGDGKTHDHECDHPCAYVAITVEDPHHLVAKTDVVRAVLAEHGVRLQPTNCDGQPCCQASYDPADGTAVI